MDKQSLINTNYLIIHRHWNNRDDPAVRSKIITLMEEIERFSDEEGARSARETIEMLQREAEICSSTNPRSQEQNSIRVPVTAIGGGSSKEGQTSNINKFVLAEKPKVKFSMIGGLKNIKDILRMEVIEPKLNEHLFRLYDRQPGCGILVWGGPGCGKTLLAEATAAECDSVFIAPPIHDLMSKWVGESEKTVSSIFDEARRMGNCVIFLDELDSLVPRTGPSYVKRIKDTFLQEMDGIYSRKENLLILGATNKPWLIDPAMRRPGRFTKVIFVPPPDFDARVEIFKIHLDGLRANGMLDGNVDFSLLGNLTSGMSGADIQAICTDAKDIPLREAINGANPRPVSAVDLLAAIKSKEKSIIPWLIEAIKSVKRYDAEEFSKPLLQLASENLKGTETSEGTKYG